ncbi:MgtC/SapB family protein [Methylobacterium sp. A49B]|uniref:Protein MgtC n=1 Tax=Methylobacterium mesophilicum SR1.6/6 TaxID=908290 RepID=A0A6B9FXV0_9HYPH|nr:MgtC/SapB family protein [Methylobacterium mesophilicum]QGY05275.1 MgtC/SapB family protein [Methylobacterium mesophilicum SR1.6/6]
MVARLALAALFGSVIGLERERLLWAAGLRTHMLVCVGSCLIMLVSAFGFSDVLGMQHVVLDPSRIAAQVVSGIGFLGAGTILLRGEVVKGLTTAASLWGVAAIGLSIGSGLYVPALAATALIVGILAGVKPFEERWRDRMRAQTLRLIARKGALSIDTLNAASGERASRVRTFAVRPSADPDLDEVTVTFVRLSRTSFEAIAAKLRALPDVTAVEEGEE